MDRWYLPPRIYILILYFVYLDHTTVSNDFIDRAVKKAVGTHIYNPRVRVRVLKAQGCQEDSKHN